MLRDASAPGILWRSEVLPRLKRNDGVAFPTHYLKKRDFLHSEKSPPAALSRIAREFLAAERYSDALDFFEKARDAEGVRQIKALALKHGDSFLLARLERFDRTLVTAADWDTVAKQAEAMGRTSMTEFIKKKFAPPATPTAAAVAGPKPGEAPGEAPLAEV
jgi:hypothetical protein